MRYQLRGIYLFAGNGKIVSNICDFLHKFWGDCFCTYGRLLQYLRKITAVLGGEYSESEFGYILGIPNEEVRQALNEIVGCTQGRRACDRT